MKFMKGPICRWNVQKMRSESSGGMWKTTGAFTNSWRIKIPLESYFEKHAQEIWERKFEEDHVVEYVQSNIDGDDSEGAS